MTWTRQQHKDLLRALDSLERVLEFYPEDPSPDLDLVTWLSRIRGALASLIEDLEDHFTAEESSWLDSRLPSVEPRHRESIERLKKEHTSILARLRAVTRDLWGPTDSSVLVKLLRETGSIVETIRKHERAESKLLDSLR